MRFGQVDAAHQNIISNLLTAHRVNRMQDTSLTNQENRFVQQLQRVLEESKPKVKPTPEARSSPVREREGSGRRFMGRGREEKERKEPESSEFDAEHQIDITV